MVVLDVVLCWFEGSDVDSGVDCEMVAVPVRWCYDVILFCRTQCNVYALNGKRTVVCHSDCLLPVIFHL